MRTRQVAAGTRAGTSMQKKDANRKPKKGSKSKSKSTTKLTQKQPSIRDSFIIAERSFDELLAPPTPMPSPHGSQSQIVANESQDSWGFKSQYSNSSTPNKKDDRRHQVIDNSSEDSVTDMSRQLRELSDTNTRLQNQIALLESDIENHLKLDQTQKAAIKKLKRENDNLRRELSKHTGMRKYANNTSACDSRTEAHRDVTLTQAQLDSLKDHVKDAIITVLSDANSEIHVEHNSGIGTQTIPDSNDEQFQQVIRRRKRRGRATQTETPPQLSEQQTRDRPGPISGNGSLNRQPLDASSHNDRNRQHTAATSTSSRSSRSYRDAAVSRPPQAPETVIIGTSLVRGVSTHLLKRGIDNACYTYPGADIPCIRSRVNHVLPRNSNPRQIVLQVGGNDLERHAPHAVRRQYDSLISEVKRSCPKSSILLGRIPPRRHDGWTNNQIDKVNTYLEDRCKRGDDVHFVDSCPRFPMQFNRDRVHFSRSGCKVYADKLACSVINFQMDTRNRRS